MFESLNRLLVLACTLILGGCSICNVSQYGTESWSFTGPVDRIHTPGAPVPAAAMFRYQVDFTFQQPDANPDLGAATYGYQRAVLEVFDDNGELFRIEDTSGRIELTDAAAGDHVMVGSGPGSSLSGALPNGGAASKVLITLAGDHEEVVLGPLSPDIDKVMPAALDLEQFKPGRLHVEFGSSDSFIEGEVRRFECP